MCTLDDAENRCSMIKLIIREEKFAEITADRCKVLFGGSAVKSSTATEAAAKPNINGFLLNNASLQAANFVGIIENALIAN